MKLLQVLGHVWRLIMRHCVIFIVIFFSLFFPPEQFHLPALYKTSCFHTRRRRKNKGEKAEGEKMKEKKQRGKDDGKTERWKQWRNFFIKMLNFCHFRSKWIDGEWPSLQCLNILKKKVPAWECGRGANRLHIKPSFFDVNCPAQLSPRTCVNPDAFMGGFRLTVCVLQPHTNLSQTCRIN